MKKMIYYLEMSVLIALMISCKFTESDLKKETGDMKMKSKVLYEELLPDEFIERINACPIAYLPLGTMEWHGLHLPLGSDGLQSKGFFMALAEEVGGIVLPMLFLGPDGTVKELDLNEFSYIGMEYRSFEEGHLQQLEGNAYYVDQEVFIKMLESIMWSLSRTGFKIVVAHGHGPSNSAFHHSIEKLEKQFGLKLYDLGMIGLHGPQGIQTDHAAYSETSLMMRIRPELVDIGKITNDENMTGISGIDPRNRASYEEGDKIIAANLAIVSEKLKKDLSEMSWEKREIKHTHVKKIYRDQ